MFALGLSTLLWVAGCAGHVVREEAGRVQLLLSEPRAAEVQFASSLDGFDLHPARKIDARTWEMTVAGGKEFAYFYVVDGQVRLPDCKYREKDEFGSYNCLFKTGP